MGVVGKVSGASASTALITNHEERKDIVREFKSRKIAFFPWTDHSIVFQSFSEFLVPKGNQSVQ